MHRNVKYGVDDEEVFYKLDGIKGLAYFAEVSALIHGICFAASLSFFFRSHFMHLCIFTFRFVDHIIFL